MKKISGLLEPGRIEKIRVRESGYRMYEYRVIGRMYGYPMHHTDCIKDAERYLRKLRNEWLTHPLPTLSSPNFEMRWLFQKANGLTEKSKGTLQNDKMS